MRMSRTAQRRVQTQIEMRHHIAQQDDEHVVVGILQRVLRCAEEEQQRVDEDESQHTHEDADDDVERHQIAQHPLRRPVVLLSQLDRDHRRTAHAHHGAERRTQVHDRERHRQTAQRERTHLGDVSDEDAVHHIVERRSRHRHHRRHGILHQQLPDRPRSQFLCPIVLHKCYLRNRLQSYE